MLRILFLGDIVARGGRGVVKSILPKLLDKYSPTVIIANAENAAGGFGIDLKSCDEIFASGVQIITSGNHIWKKKEIIQYLEKKSDKIIRPVNFPPDAPGKGYLIHELPNGKKLGVANAMGRVFMSELLDCPFRAADQLLENELSHCDYTFFDFHAETTSEKVAFGHHLDGRASVVVGTHTHVQTADERVLPGGTAYITDVGMCGPRNGVIGMEKEAVINKFTKAISSGFSPIVKGEMILNGVLVDIKEVSEEENGSPKQDVSIQRIYEVTLGK